MPGGLGLLWEGGMSLKCVFIVFATCTAMIPIVLMTSMNTIENERGNMYKLLKRIEEHVLIDKSAMPLGETFMRNENYVKGGYTSGMMKVELNATGTTATTKVEPVMKLITRLFFMACDNPDRLFKIIEGEDPLGVARGPVSFTCPSDNDQLVDFPNVVNHTVEHEFRGNEQGHWILYQHLRKAGGTGFCDLASSNMLRNEIPPYYCMPDNRGSLATPPWDDGLYISEYMKRKGYKIASNEWDAFFDEMFTWPGVVFATTIRDPIDRWISQYRFEVLERRDGSKISREQENMTSIELAYLCSSCSGFNVEFCENTLKLKCLRHYYDSLSTWSMGSNYYVKTFRGEKNKKWNGNKGDFYWTYHKFQHLKISWDTFKVSLDNLRKFNLILVMEWIDSSAAIINDTLGWKALSKQVLPHEVQAKRIVGKNGKKRSLEAKHLMSSEEHMYFVRENIYDVLFYYVFKRVYLERLHNCKV